MRDGARVAFDVPVIRSTDRWMQWVGLTADQLRGRVRNQMGLRALCPLEYTIAEAMELAPVCLRTEEDQPLLAWSLVPGFDPDRPYDLEIVKMASWRGEMIPVIVGARRATPSFEGAVLSPAQLAGAHRRFHGPPIQALERRAADLEAATGIVGRRPLLKLIALTLHSRLHIVYRGHPLGRATLDTIVIGDRGTGKSEAASRLARYFNVAAPICGEIVSRAGLLAGSVRRPGGAFAALPGRFPMLDRKAALVDEAHAFLTSPSFAQTSQWRSTGIVNIDMAGANRAFPARVRVCWIANPQGGQRNLRTALAALVSRPEDRRRFDLGLFIPKGEPPQLPTSTHAPHRQADRAILTASWAKTDALEVQDFLVPAVENAAGAVRRSTSPHQPDLADSDAIEETIVRLAAAVAETTVRDLDAECIDAARILIEEQGKC